MKKWFKQLTCKHKFDYNDLIGRCEVDGENVRWPCWKCGKVFEEHFGFNVLNHGEVQSKPIQEKTRISKHHRKMMDQLAEMMDQLAYLCEVNPYAKVYIYHRLKMAEGREKSEEVDNEN